MSNEKEVAELRSRVEEIAKQFNELSSAMSERYDAMRNAAIRAGAENTVLKGALSIVMTPQQRETLRVTMASQNLTHLPEDAAEALRKAFAEFLQPHRS